MVLVRRVSVRRHPSAEGGKADESQEASSTTLTRSSRRQADAAGSSPSFDDDVTVETEAASPAPSAASSTAESATPEPESCRIFYIGERVFAKMKGYPHWPAIITEWRLERPLVPDEKTLPGNRVKVPSGQKKAPARRRYTLLFYGTKESANLDGKDLIIYEENKEKYGKPKNVAGFNAAMREVEDEIAHKDDDASETRRARGRFSRRQAAAAAAAARDSPPAIEFFPAAAPESPNEDLDSKSEAPLNDETQKIAKSLRKRPSAEVEEGVDKESVSKKQKLEVDKPQEDDAEAQPQIPRRRTRGRPARAAPLNMDVDSSVSSPKEEPVSIDTSSSTVDDAAAPPASVASNTKEKGEKAKAVTPASVASRKSTSNPEAPPKTSLGSAAPIETESSSTKPPIKSEKSVNSKTAAESRTDSESDSAAPPPRSSRRKTMSDAEKEAKLNSEAENEKPKPQKTESEKLPSKSEAKLKVEPKISSNQVPAPHVGSELADRIRDMDRGNETGSPSEVMHLGDNDILRGAYNYDPLPREYQDAYRLPLLFSKIAVPDIPEEGPWADKRVVDDVTYEPFQLTYADRRLLREKALQKYKEVRKEAWNAFVLPNPKNSRAFNKEGELIGVPDEKPKETKKAKKSLTAEELGKKKDEAKLRKIKEKIEIMRREKQLMLIDLEIKKSLRRGSEDVRRAAVVLDYLMEQSVSALMLIRCPQIVHTIRKVKNYKKDSSVCAKANTIYMRFRQLFFLTAQSKSFDEVFDRECARFKSLGKKTHLEQMEQFEEKREEREKLAKEDSPSEGDEAGEGSSDRNESQPSRKKRVERKESGKRKMKSNDEVEGEVSATSKSKQVKTSAVKDEALVKPTKRAKFVAPKTKATSSTTKLKTEQDPPKDKLDTKVEDMEVDSATSEVSVREEGDGVMSDEVGLENNESSVRINPDDGDETGTSVPQSTRDLIEIESVKEEKGKGREQQSEVEEHTSTSDATVVNDLVDANDAERKEKEDIKERNATDVKFVGPDNATKQTDYPVPRSPFMNPKVDEKVSGDADCLDQKNKDDVVEVKDDDLKIKMVVDSQDLNAVEKDDDRNKHRKQDDATDDDGEKLDGKSDKNSDVVNEYDESLNITSKEVSSSNQVEESGIIASTRLSSESATGQEAKDNDVDVVVSESTTEESLRPLGKKTEVEPEEKPIE